MTALAGLPLVSLTVFLPLLGAILIGFTPSGRPNVARYMALGFALLAWVVSLALLVSFVATNGEFQFVDQASWIPMFGTSKFVPTDGYYWTGYPTATNPYYGPWWWWANFYFVLPKLQPTGKTS